MPAAELNRLRAQINSLVQRFEDPVDLRNGLRDLLELYGNRAYRAGQAVQTQSILPTYRITPLVMRQLEMELSKTCQEQPAAALNAVEAIWKDAYLEPRMLACTLLGSIPASHAEAVSQKLRQWAKPEENSRMLDALFELGTVMLRREEPHRVLALVEEWIGSHRADRQALGLRALTPLVRDPAFENLPPVFRLLSPLVQHVQQPLQTDLQIVLESLAKRASTETAYFLRQTLSMSSGPGTARLIRRCLPAFEPEEQRSLRVALQSANPP